MKRIKRIALIAAAVITCITTGAAVTLAYLHAQTETKNNVFTSDKKISIQLREPAWDGYTFEDAVSDGKTVKESLSESEKSTLGLTQALAYVPGQTVPKNPMVRNSGGIKTGVPVYTAMKVQYFSGEDEVTYEEFADAYLDYGIAFSGEWERMSLQGVGAETAKYDLYLYKKVLEVGNTTPALFTEVPLSEDISAGQDGKLPGFRIQVTAYGIQSSFVDTNRIEETMKNFVTENE